MNNSLMSLLRDERGQSMVEYGVAVALVSAVAFGAFQALGGSVVKAIGDLNGKLGGAGTSPIPR